MPLFDFPIERFHLQNARPQLERLEKLPHKFQGVPHDIQGFLPHAALLGHRLVVHGGRHRNVIAHERRHFAAHVERAARHAGFVLGQPRLEFLTNTAKDAERRCAFPVRRDRRPDSVPHRVCEI